MRVLVVEDEVRLALAIEAGLNNEGFEVTLAHDGRRGYALAAEHQYDAILLDIMLPGMNGYLVCRALRADGITTPILMLTAKDGEYDEAEGLDTGADDFLRKPFSFVVLVARLRALARRSAAAPAPLVKGTLRLDRARRTCRVAGADIDLTERETEVLTLLMERDGQPVDKHAILERVWGPEQARDPNIVEVYIGYLRRKLGPERVQTVRGLGYQLVEH